MKFAKTLFAVVALCGATSGAHALMIDFAPNDQVVGLSEQVSVDIIVSDFGGEFVGGFDFNVSWDDTILGFVDIAFDSYLDGPGLSFQDSILLSGSEINVAEVSFGPLFNQDGFADIVLFTLTFDTLATGISALDLTGNLGLGADFLVDDLGNILGVDIGNGSIEVVTAQVPEPSSLALFGLGGLLLLGGSRRFKKAAIKPA